MCGSGRFRLSLASLLLCGSSLVPASASQDAPPRVFSSHSELVVVHVTVKDRKAGLVAGLTREAFTVRENGRPETVSFFHNEDTPVTVGLVLDCSTSMYRKRDAVIAAGLAFARSIHPGDEMFTVNFNEQVWHGLPPSMPFTTDYEQLRNALQRSTARGKTALFDGMQSALAHLDKGHYQKKVLILVSDGGDNASSTTFDAVLDTALRSDAIIYTLSIHDEYDGDAKPDVLRRLAKATGGEAYFAHDPADSTAVLERIAREVRSGYTIGYVPSGSDSGFHAIRVEAHAPDGRALVVRARSGYLAGPAPASDDHK